MSATLIDLVLLTEARARIGIGVNNLGVTPVWVAQFDEPVAIDEATAVLPGATLGDARIPLPGALYAMSGTSLLVDSLEIERDSRIDDGTRWRVTANFAINIAALSNVEPWLRYDKITGAGQRYNLAAAKDADDKPIKNAAGDPIEGVIIPKHNRILNITRYRLLNTYDPFAFNLEDSINDATITFHPRSGAKSFDAKTCLLHEFTFSEASWHDGTEYWELRFKIEVAKAVPFDEMELANKGYRVLKDGKRCIASHAVLTNDGAPLVVNGVAVREAVHAPIFLNDDGTELDPADDPTFYNIIIKPHKAMDWSGLLA